MTLTFPRRNMNSLPGEESSMIMGGSVPDCVRAQQGETPWPRLGMTSYGNKTCELPSLELDNEMGNSSLAHVPPRE